MIIGATLSRVEGLNPGLVNLGGQPRGGAAEPWISWSRRRQVHHTGTPSCHLNGSAIDIVIHATSPVSFTTVPRTLSSALRESRFAA